MDRPAQSIERLPLLALEIICFYIDDEGGSGDLRRSLWAFSLTSRRCGAAAAVQRFSQIHLRLRSVDTMAARVQLLIDEGLGGGERFRHVRRLRVSGGMSRREADIIRAKEMALERRALYPSQRATEQALEALKDDRDISEVDRDLHTKETKSIQARQGSLGSSAHSIRHVFGDDLHPFCRPRHDRHGRIVHGGSASLDAVKVTLHTDDAWLPLAKLVRQLPGLRDLVWDATSYLPRDVLAAIHETPSLRGEARGGGCRIHMHQFALHSLSHYRSHSTQSPISEDEYALVTSANLYSVIATVQSRMLLDRVSFMGHALLQEMLGRGRSPNLRHVWFSQVPGNTFVGQNGVADEEEGPEWQGFFPVQPDQPDQEGESSGAGKGKERPPAPHRPRNRTALTSLVFWNNAPSTVYTNWLRGGDYSKLRNLTLFWDRELIEHLADRASEGRFGALDSFTLLGARDGQYLVLDPGDYYGDYPDGTCYEDDYAQVDEDVVEQNLLMYLFHKLPPLRSLQYEGTLGQWTARHIYKHHGPTLRRLSLTLKEPANAHPMYTWLSRFDIDAAQELAGRCPDLEELSLDMQRSGGDSDEARAYRTLSNETLKHLERLELRLWYRIGPMPQYVEPDHAIHGFGWTPGVNQAMPAGQEGGVAGAIELDGQVEAEANNRRPNTENDWDRVRLVEDIPMDILKRALVDCAMDEKLARSIFAELEFTPSGKSRFQHLRFEIARDAEPEDPGVSDTMFKSLLRWLGRSYVVERGLGRGGQVVVRETDPTTTIKSGRLWQHLASQRTDDKAVQVIRDAFQALWPNKTESWWEGWSSAPLDTDVDTPEMSLEETIRHLIEEQSSDDEI